MKAEERLPELRRHSKLFLLYPFSVSLIAEGTVGVDTYLRIDLVATMAYIHWKKKQRRRWQKWQPLTRVHPCATYRSTWSPKRRWNRYAKRLGRKRTDRGWRQYAAVVISNVSSRIIVTWGSDKVYFYFQVISWHSVVWDTLSIPVQYNLNKQRAVGGVKFKVKMLECTSSRQKRINQLKRKIGKTETLTVVRWEERIDKKIDHVVSYSSIFWVALSSSDR